MAILICNIIDGIVKNTKEETITITNKDMTAVGLHIEDIDKLQEKDDLNELLVKYQNINLACFTDYNSIPLRFGNIVNNEDEVRNFLDKTYIQLKSLLNKVDGKAEFVIKVSLDLENITKKISNQIDFSNRLAVGKAIFELSEQYKTNLYESFKQKLSAVAIESAESNQVNETIILNLSYLIQKEDEEKFDEIINELARETDDIPIFNLLGPLPPYSFVPIEFNKGVFELINNARLLLGLTEMCTIKDVKSNYKKLSQQYHPDKNPTGEDKFKAINEAYQLVLSYCKSIGMNKRYSFNKEAIEGHFIN